MGLLTRAETILVERVKGKAGVVALTRSVLQQYEGANKLVAYVEKNTDDGFQPYAIELTVETLVDQLVVQSEDDVAETEILEQWMSLIQETLSTNGFMVRMDQHKFVIIDSSREKVREQSLFQKIADFASDVFGVDAQVEWFEPAFYIIDETALERLNPWVR